MNDFERDKARLKSWVQPIGTRETADHIGGANEKVTRECIRGLQSIEDRVCEGDPFRFTGGTIYFKSINALENLLSEIAALRGRENELIATHAVAVMRIERQRDELRKALEPFAALADKFGCWSVVEVCAPEPGNASPVIQPVPLSAFETAAALIANQGADQ